MYGYCHVLLLYSLDYLVKLLNNYSTGTSKYNSTGILCLAHYLMPPCQRYTFYLLTDVVSIKASPTPLGALQLILP